MASIRCKSCGGPVQDVESDYFTCPYCGSRQENRKGRVKKNVIPQQPVAQGSKKYIMVICSVTAAIAVAAGVVFYSSTKNRESAHPAILEVIRFPSAVCGIMHGDEGLRAGEEYSSCDRRFILKMQNDGNLVLYMGKNPLWATNTAGAGTAQAIMQRDGNFVLYDTKGRPVWATNTLDASGAYFAVQDDGNLVVYTSSGKPVWASHTCCY